MPMSTMVQTATIICCLSIVGVFNVLASGLDPSENQSTRTPGAFRLVRVSKEERGGVYHLRVDFHGPQPRSIKLTDYGWRGVRYVTAEEAGVLKVAIPKGPNVLDRWVRLTFDLGEKRLSADVRLESPISSVAVPALDVVQRGGNVATFRAGQRPRLDYAVLVEDHPEAVEALHLRYGVTVVSEDEAGVAMRYTSLHHEHVARNPVWAEIQQEQVDTGDRRISAVINSSSDHDVEGVFYLEIQVRLCSPLRLDCLLSGMILPTDSVAFYREDHRSPYPAGFLGFIVSDLYPSAFDFYCQVGDVHCRVMCQVTGNERPTIAFSPENTAGSEPDKLTQTERHGPRWSQSWISLHNVSWEDEGIFTCTAKDRVQQASRSIRLHIVQWATIDMDSSNFTRMSNGSVTAVCIATGVPAPNVRFLTENKPLADVSPRDYDIAVTSLDERTTEAVLYIHDPEVAQTVSDVECEASNIPDGVRRTPDRLLLSEDGVWDYDYPVEDNALY